MAIENKNEEEIMFYTPTFGNSIFIANVQEEDEKIIIRLFQKIGLLYRAEKTKTNNKITHYQFYSRLAFEKVKDLYCTFQGTKYQYKPMPGTMFNYAVFTLSDNYNFTDKIRLLRQEQMFELCNYYFGYQNWSIEQSYIEPIREYSENSGDRIKYKAEYKAEMILTFRKYPGIKIIGKGKSTSGGYDRLDVINMAIKFAITSARKDIFKKLKIGIKEENGIREIRPIIERLPVPNYFEQIFKDSIEQQYGEELNFDEDNLTKETIQDYADILSAMDEEIGEAEDKIQGENMSDAEKEDGVSDEIHDENSGDEISLLDVSEDGEEEGRMKLELLKK